jgi:hypothetical protein
MTYYIKTGVKKGRVHRFRYRAKNAVGWGPYSDENSILAANVPSAPSQPSFLNFYSNNTLSVKINPSEDNGGTAITHMELWKDAGNNFTSAFTLVTNHSGILSSYLFTSSDMVLSRTYRIKVLSRNAHGASAFSTITYIAFGPVSTAPG